MKEGAVSSSSVSDPVQRPSSSSSATLLRTQHEEKQYSKPSSPKPTAPKASGSIPQSPSSPSKNVAIKASQTSQASAESSKKPRLSEVEQGSGSDAWPDTISSLFLQLDCRRPESVEKPVYLVENDPMSPKVFFRADLEYRLFQLARSYSFRGDITGLNLRAPFLCENGTLNLKVLREVAVMNADHYPLATGTEFKSAVFDDLERRFLRMLPDSAMQLQGSSQPLRQVMKQPWTEQIALVKKQCQNKTNNELFVPDLSLSPGFRPRACFYG